MTDDHNADLTGHHRRWPFVGLLLVATLGAALLVGITSSNYILASLVAIFAIGASVVLRISDLNRREQRSQKGHHYAGGG